MQSVSTVDTMRTQMLHERAQAGLPAQVVMHPSPCADLDVPTHSSAQGVTAMAVTAPFLQACAHHTRASGSVRPARGASSQMDRRRPSGLRVSCCSVWLSLLTEQVCCEARRRAPATG